MSIRRVVAIRLHPNTIEELTLEAKVKGTSFLSLCRELLEDYAPGRDTRALARRVAKLGEKKTKNRLHR